MLPCPSIGNAFQRDEQAATIKSEVWQVALPLFLETIFVIVISSAMPAEVTSVIRRHFSIVRYKCC